MIANLKPYPAYKDSGMEWLGKVPEHWEVQRAKNLLCAIDIRSEAGEEELLTVSSSLGVIPRSSANVTMFKAESYAGYKLCWPGDLVINSLWAWARGLGVSKNHGIISTAYGVYRPMHEGVINPRFIHELVRSTPFHWELRVRSKGIWTSRLQLTDDSFLGSPLICPPLPEQTAIIRFLDYVDHRIKRYIAAKQKLIKLLEEYKQGIINQAVTGQIDVRTGKPYPTYKDSGVDWLGEVPEHWEVQRAKNLLCAIDIRSEAGEEELLTVSSSLGVIPRSSANVTMFKAESYAGYKLCWPGDLVINSLWAWARGLGVSKNHGIISTAYGVYRPRYEGVINPRFIHELVRSTPFHWELRVRSKGIWTSRLQLTDDSFLGSPLICPPLPEQTAIVRFLDQKCETVDKQIDQARREVELLREYRTRLIADVVTGKTDVSGWDEC